MKKSNSVMLGVEFGCGNLVYFDGREAIEKIFKVGAVFSIGKFSDFNKKNYKFNPPVNTEYKNFKVISQKINFFRSTKIVRSIPIVRFGNFVITLECIPTENERTIRGNKIKIRDQYYPISVLKVSNK